MATLNESAETGRFIVGRLTRPKFTIANLLLLAIIVGLTGRVVLDHFRLKEVETELVRHDAVEVQRQRVMRRESELRALEQSLAPQDRLAGLFRLTGTGNDSMRHGSASLDAPPMGVEFSVPIGYRRTRTMIRNVELRTMKDRGLLRDLEEDLTERIAERNKVRTGG